jgi:hypothetical protein
MPDKKEPLCSRREFAQRAALLTASLVPAGLVLEKSALPAAPQLPENLPKLSPEEQIEAEARFQAILSQHGTRFNADQKALIQGLCIFLQPALEHLRAYPLQNCDAPALYLKPLVERERKPQASPTAGPAPAALKKS